MASNSEMLCPKCGEPLYRVSGLSTESEGFREDCWCEECHTMFKCTKAMLVPRLVLKDAYAGVAADRIRRHAELILKELHTELADKVERDLRAEQKANRKLAHIIKKGTP
jgi:hypothetical protein